MTQCPESRCFAAAVLIGLPLALPSACTRSGPGWTEAGSGTTRIVTQPDGPTLGYSTASGVTILEEDGRAFKDLNRNGVLDPYEDWRRPTDERARDLADRMSVEQIAGLMLYSAHQRVPAASGGFGGGMYGGRPFEESGAAPGELTDQQRRFLTDDNLRHVLITSVESPAVAARWSNEVQALVEGIGLGIPANNSSDPRHETVAEAEYSAGAGGAISMWPSSIGMAATFDPELVRSFGEIASREYRALGITTALSPQIDIATDPRWGRFAGTFGPDPRLAADMARAYVDGFQTSEGDGIERGWGYESVNAMVKHWPGGGSGEGGRDAHYGFGKYAVYPGGNFDLHLLPFIEGAFDLDGETGRAAAVMPYYTISFGQDTVYGETVGNAFSRYIIGDLLRGRYGYDGVLCTDWGVTRDHEALDAFGRAPWGVEHLTEAERHYKALMAGVDQFGGNNAAGPVIEAFAMGVEERGEAFMRERFEASAVRLLRNIFRPGLFENPYLDVEVTERVVGSPGFMAAGYQAQLRSLVLLKNREDALPLRRGATVWIPQRWVPESRGFFGNVNPARHEDALNMEIAGRYYDVTDDPAGAHAAIVVIENPAFGVGTGYSADDVAAGGNGYLPISLQYREYTAEHARDPSIAGGDPLEDFTNRSYRGKTVTTSNVTDLEAVLNARRVMGDRPVIVVLETGNPVVVSEFEPSADAILLSFGVQDHAILDMLAGEAEPSGLLPFQVPADMRTVEEQYEDTPLDMRPHVDAAGHAYDFGFGLDWRGVIVDARTAAYGGEPVSVGARR